MFHFEKCPFAEPKGFDQICVDFLTPLWWGECPKPSEGLSVRALGSPSSIKLILKEGAKIRGADCYQVSVGRRIWPEPD